MADQENAGGMIALVPQDPGTLAVPGGDPAEELHLTLAYLGSDVSQLSDAVRAGLAEHVSSMANQLPPIDARIMGHALWNPDGGPEGDMDPCAIYQIQQHGMLDDAMHWARDGAQGRMGADFPQQHPGFLPHVTAGYGIEPAALDYAGPVQFNALRLALGDTVQDFPLTGHPYSDDMRYSSEVQGFAAAKPAIKEAPDVAVPDSMEGEIPVTFPVIIVEGMETSDGRYIEPGALSHRALPLPILAQIRNPDGGDGHDGADVIGRLETLTRTPGPDVVDKETGKPFPEGTFVWSGTGHVDPDAAGTKLATKGYLTGNSADLSDVEAEFVWGSDEEDDGAQNGPQQIRMTSGKIAATTLVPIPAFAQAYIQIDGQDTTPNADAIAAGASPSWLSADLGDDCLMCEAAPDGFAVSKAKRDKAKAAGHAMPDGSYPIETADDLEKAIKAVGRGGADHDAIRKHIIKQAKRLDASDHIPDNWNSDGSLKGVVASAGVTQLAPPAHAFRDPVLGQPTPLTLDHDSIPGFIEVYGHLAEWGTCHVGYVGQCVTPPHSRQDYGYFNVGAVRCHDAGKAVVVAAGHITMGEGGHAGMKLSAADAAAYYDNVNTVVADVTAGEDGHGIWVHGVMRRTATPEQIDALRASPLSGDWRPINDGPLELVAALAVNSGGFPIPRARVASGAVMALVAAGVVGRVDPEPLPQIDVAALADLVEVELAARSDLRKRGQSARDAFMEARGAAARRWVAEHNERLAVRRADLEKVLGLN